MYFINLIIHLVNSTNNKPYEYSAFSNLLYFLPPRPTCSGTMFSGEFDQQRTVHRDIFL